MTRSIRTGIGLLTGACERRILSVAFAFAVAFAAIGVAPSPSFASVSGADRIGGVLASDRELAASQMPDVDLASGLLMAQDGSELWSRASADRRAMASITKIMTAVVALEKAGLDDPVRVSRHAARTVESESGIRSGETYTMRELLEAMLVKSGNDAAVAIAEHVAGDEGAYVKLMNAKAAELGLSNTNFTNPHGLDEDGHHTTAADLAVLSRYAMSKPEFRRIVAMPFIQVDGHKLENSNQLVGTYTGANGIKTGWTGDAGYCVIASAARGGTELYAVVLGTKTEAQRFDEARKLFDWGFAHYRTQSLAASGSVVGAVSVSDYIDTSVAARISQDLTATIFDLDGPVDSKLVLDEEVAAPVKAGQRLGEITFTQGEQLVGRVPVVAASDVVAPTTLERVGIFFRRLWLRIAG